MSMLAERKRKTKWVINPTKKPLWTTDPVGVKFGKELMEKMGWSAGKGLGVNEQGIQEPLRVSYKNDTKGMGFKGNDNDWIEQQDEFNELLCQLRKDDTCNVNVSEKEIKSLEEKSKQSRVRVHYQKFTRGKDLSRYSENDLACILGLSKMKKEKSKTDEVTHMDSEVPESYETSFGVTTINSGSIQDYFKKKWIFDKNSEDLPALNNEVKNFTQNSFECESCFAENEENLMSDNKEKKLKNRKHKSFSEELLSANELNSLENVENNKKSMKEGVEINLEEPKAKKRKKYCDETVQGITNNFDDAVDFNYESENLIKKKKRKNQNLQDLTMADFASDCSEKKKRKSRYETCISDDLSFEKSKNVIEKENAVDFELKEKKKKKKSKKEKVKEDCNIKDNLIASVNNQSDQEEPEPVLEIKSVKRKKKDKEKEGGSEKIKNINCDINENCVDLKKKIDELQTTDNFTKSVRKKKKKKKKDKKENSDEESNEIECKDYFSSEIEEGLKENVGIKELECKMTMELVKKKKAKKDKKEKKEKKTKNISNEKKDKVKDEKVKSQGMNCHSDQVIELCLEVPEAEKITEEVNKTSMDESMPEMEPVNKEKKKKKKDKLEGREINENSFTEERSKEENVSVNEEENTFEVKIVKNKKKSKKENGDLNHDTDHIEEPIVNMRKPECTEEIESVKKKKKKKSREEKEKKESKSPHQQSEEAEKLFLDEAFKEKKINTRDQENALKFKLYKEKNEKLENSCKPEAEGNEKTQIEVNNWKPNTETIDKKGLIGRNEIKAAEEEDKGVHQHKVALLNEKRADKFYPGGYDRVLRLTLWTNIAGFKGSNLENVSGYGSPRKLQTNKLT